LFTIGKLWKQPRYPTTDEWIKKMEFYSAIRKNETTWFEGKWMKDIRLSELSQAQKDKRLHIFSHMWETDKYKYKQCYEKQVMLREVTNGRGRVKKEVKKVNMGDILYRQE
jgi:hypothetical protein